MSYIQKPEGDTHLSLTPASLIKLTIFVAIPIYLIIAIVLGSSLAPTFVMPGPLMSKHAPIGEDCSRCHIGLEGRTKGLMHGWGSSESALAESKLCLKCHEKLGDFALNAHSMSPNRLAHASEETKQSYACTSCHRDHQGRDADLKLLSSKACQSCHEESFASLEHGHPDFNAALSKRRTKIAYDHAMHEQKYFPENKASYSCNNCHVMNHETGGMQTKSYEDACTSCHHHDQQIAGLKRMQSGIAIIQMPAIDIEALEDADINIGDWPAPAEDYDGEPTAFMHSLMRGDAQGQQALAGVAGLDLMDLMDASEDELKAVEEYVWQVKRLVGKLASGKVSDYLPLGEGFESSQALARSFTPAAMASVSKLWFPELASFLNQRYTNENWSPESNEVKQWFGVGEWYYEDENQTLYYQARLHNDASLKAWHDFALYEANYAPESSRASSVLLTDLQKDVERCIKCHSLDQDSKGKFSIQWHATSIAVEPTLNKFSHKPHLLIEDLLLQKLQGAQVSDQGLTSGDCESCHRLKAKASPMKSYEQKDPSKFESAFETITKDFCAQCHNERVVGDSCTTCHNYHAMGQ